MAIKTCKRGHRKTAATSRLQKNYHRLKSGKRRIYRTRVCKLCIRITRRRIAKSRGLR